MQTATPICRHDALSRWLAPSLVITVLIVVSAVIYLPHLDAPLLYDDGPIIAANPYIQNLHNLPRFLAPGYWNDLHEGTKGLYRPLREMTFTLIFWAAGPRPWAFSLVSFAFNLGCVLLIYHLGRRLLGGLLAPALGAMLFAAHPVHVEAVLWRKNLGEVMCGFFALGALALFVRAREEWARSSPPMDAPSASLANIPAKPKANRARLFTAAAAAAYTLALLCKESALALALIIFIYAVFVGERDDWRRGLRLASPFLVVAAAYLAFQLFCLKLVQTTVSAPAPNEGFSLFFRPALVAKTIAMYHRLLLWPVQLSAKYDFVLPESYFGYETRWHLLGSVVLVVTIVLAWRRWRAGRWLIPWTVLFLGPAANIIPFIGRPIGEQRLYLPSAGFCLLIGAAAAHVINHERLNRAIRRFVAGLMIAVALILGALAIARANQNDSWSAFWRDLIVKSPFQAANQAIFGKKYLEGKYELPEQARSHALIALQHEPKNVAAYELLGLSAGAESDHLMAAAWFAKVCELALDYPGGWRNLGIALVNLGDWRSAIEPLQKAVALDAGDETPWLYLGFALMRSDRADEAAAAWTRLVGIAEKRAARGQVEEARNLLMGVLELQPGYVPAREALARLPAK